MFYFFIAFNTSLREFEQLTTFKKHFKFTKELDYSGLRILLFTNVHELSVNNKILDRVNVYPGRITFNDYEDHLFSQVAISLQFTSKDEIIIELDNIASIPVYFIADNGSLYLSNHFKVLKEKCLQTEDINLDFLAASLIKTYSSYTGTFFKHIHKLNPGKSLVKKEGVECVEASTFKNIPELFKMPFHDVVHELESKLNQLFRTQYNYSKIATELSGGLDSSLVTYLARQHNPNLVSFSHTLNNVHPIKDESNEIELITNSLNINNVSFEQNNGSLIELIDQSQKILGHPAQQNYEVLSIPIYSKMQQLKIHYLLSGFGGDQGISNKGFKLLNEYAYRREWMKLYNLSIQTHNYTNKFDHLKYVIYQMVNTYNLNVRALTTNKKNKVNSLLNQLPLTRTAIKKFDIEQRLHEKLSNSNNCTLQEFQKKLLTSSFLFQRVEYAYNIGSHYNVSIQYPFLHKNILDFVVNLNPELFLHKGESRYLMRKLMQNKLPGEIVNRNVKNIMAIPAVYQLHLNDLYNIVDFLNLCKKKNIGTEYFNLDKMIQWAYRIKSRSTTENMLQPYFINYLSILRYFYLNAK